MFPKVGKGRCSGILQAMAHFTCHTAHICFLWSGPGSAGCSASFVTCPIVVGGALVSLPAGKNSCLMMFKEAEYFPSHARLWGRKQCLAHVSSVVLVASHTPHSSFVGCGFGRRRNSVVWLCELVKSLPSRGSVLGGVAGCLCVSFDFALRPLVIQQHPPTPCSSSTVPTCPFSCWSTQSAPVPPLA